MSDKPVVEFVEAERAVQKIHTGDTVTVSGLGNILCPEKTLTALKERFHSTGNPSDLTIFTPIRPGNENTGLENFSHQDMLDRLITGSFNTATQPQISELVTENKIEAYAFPMGISFQLLEQQAAGSPGFVTPVGLGTYVDPRRKGGKYTQSTEEDLVEVIEVQGKEFLFYRTFPIDVAILKGTTVDPQGNLTLEHEPNDLGIKTMAMAAHNSGGTVLAQVKRRTACTHRESRSIEVPGSLIDYVVVNPEQKQILGQEQMVDALTGSGHLRLESGDVDGIKQLETRKQIILNRALKELSPNDLVNLGVGMPVYLPQVAMEHGMFEDVTFTTEHGLIGGVPNPREFGSHYNPQATLSSGEIFRLYQGGGLDITFLGLAQIDSSGNVNNSNFAGMLRGPGGFIDITNRTDTIVFCGSLTAGGLTVSVVDGQIQIEEEGKHRKFLEEIEEITLSANTILNRGCEIKVITERGCFEVTETGLKLTEVAPGIDIDTHIGKHIDFDFTVVENLGEYDLRPGVNSA